MIRVGIIGGSDPLAGELLRLLVNHPDVQIMWVNSMRYAGRLVSDVHHGLLGETDLRVTPNTDLDQINLLFIFRHKGQTIEWLRDRVLPDDLHIIDLSVDMQDPELATENGFTYGLPELNRKVMVRGAKRAIIPHAISSLCALSLLPLAIEEKTDEDIEVEVSVPRACESPERTLDEIADETAFALRELHPTFNKHIDIHTTPSDSARVIQSVTSIPTTVDIGTAQRMYEEFYDDHNFVFIVNNRELDPREVEGTNKCLITLDKQDGLLVITSMFDVLIKGAAGTAVHDMNLLFGLYERAGLSLKASAY